MKEQYKRIKSYSFSFKLIDKLKKPFDKEEANEHKKKIEDNCLNNLSSILVRPFE